MSKGNQAIMKRIATVLISTLGLATAVAQDDLLVEQAEEDVRRYTVEVIIFSYEEDVFVGTEVFLPDEPPVEEDLLIEEELLIDEDAGNIEPVDILDQNFAEEEETETDEDALELILLTEEELTLGDAARQFELLDAYETIMHLGWSQATYPEEETKPIELRVLGEPPDGLDGTFSLYLSRYLHLVVNLALDAKDEIDVAVPADDPLFSFGDHRLPNDDRFELAPQPVRYLIQENRIVRNGELRYFDHPKFGVLAKITRVEEDKEDEFSDDEVPDPLVSGTGQ